MGLFNRIASLFSGGGEGDRDVYRTRVRCARCGEVIPVRVDLGRELTRQYGQGEAAYYVHKGVVGSGENRCFKTIDVRLMFDDQKQLLSREASGGSFVEGEEPESRTSG
jgi:hypothetical protein